jgi:hypothetical protein
LRATVRLQVEDAEGISYGTGTIIDTHGSEALVVTCGHIFRDSQGKGRITAYLFATGSAEPVPGQLIHFVADQKQGDIGFVAIRPNVPVDPVVVGNPGLQVQNNDPVFSIGCDRGADPTVQRTQITAINRYLGSPNYEVGFQPLDGRSGGGLFAADGTLIGICNAADPAERRGIFAALPAVQRELAQIGQQRIYMQHGQNELPIIARDEPRQPTPPLETIPEMPDQMPRSDRGSLGATTNALAHSHEHEVICIVPDPQAPNGRRVLILKDPSKDLLDQLMRESQGRATLELADRGWSRDSGPVVRGQSE